MSQSGLLALAGILGLILGSFVNVVATRLPALLDHRARREAAGEVDLAADQPPPGLWRPASHCPACGTPLAVWQLLPLVGFALLRGRCAACGGAIPWRYPLLELLGAGIALLAVQRFGWDASGLAAGLFGLLLLAAAAIDAETQILPDALVLPTLWLGLAVNAFELFAQPASAILGAAIGYGALRLVNESYRLLRGRDGLGLGDCKLAAALGAWVGWQALPLALLLAIALGVLSGLLLLLTRRQAADQPFAFGPMLAAAGFLVLLHGEALATFYWSHLG